MIFLIETILIANNDCKFQQKPLSRREIYFGLISSLISLLLTKLFRYEWTEMEFFSSKLCYYKRSQINFSLIDNYCKRIALVNNGLRTTKKILTRL